MSELEYGWIKIRRKHSPEIEQLVEEARLLALRIRAANYALPLSTTDLETIKRMIAFTDGRDNVPDRLMDIRNELKAFLERNNRD